ncbi:phospholipid carrier-dependent glycosyltransferase [Marinicella sp. W31]|uniref:phospholipid carrier-dependent glycosyltransferase n=1 Tax=Marinicella sp. W31 TaxID=3023713 RepID=UPI003757098D
MTEQVQEKPYKGKKYLIRWLIIIALIGLAILRSWWGTRLDSFTVDEPYHVVSGISYVQTGDFRLNPEHPPLTKLWVGLLAPDNFKLRRFEPLKDKYSERNFLEETMYYDNDFDRAQQAARIAMWSFNGVLMLVLLLLVWRIWSFAAAVVVGVFLVLEPTVAAHMPVVMTDLPVALALAITALCAAQWVRCWHWGWGLGLAVSTGVALAIKFSALPGVVAIYLLTGVLALTPVFKKHWQTALKRSVQVVLSGILAVLLLWASYGFQYHASADGSDPFNRSLNQKIDDLSVPHWPELLRFVDSLQVLPKAYVWGLADTVKAGVEGRGRPMHFVYGVKHIGEPPWFFWPAVVASKVPLPLLFLFVLSCLVLSVRWFANYKHRAGNDAPSTNHLLMITVLAGVYLLTLMSSHGTYAGIRHALPLVVVMAVVSGVLIWAIRHSSIRWLVGAVFSLTLALTWQEKRLWEYHNETVGGTENAHEYFASESLDLGQRIKEMERFIKDNRLETVDKFKYIWLIDEELKARGIAFTEIAKDIDDDNYEGIYEGYFFMQVSDLLPWEGWDPKGLEVLEYVTRIGHVYVMKGRYVDPKDWALGMHAKVRQYIVENENPDWDKVALRLQQITAQIDYRDYLYVELGNSYIKTEQRDKAIAAYQKALGLMDESKTYRRKITTQIEALKSNQPMTEIAILRPDNVE